MEMNNNEDLCWYEKKDLMNKGLLPDPDDELHELALKMIAERDQEGEYSRATTQKRLPRSW